MKLLGRIKKFFGANDEQACKIDFNRTLEKRRSKKKTDIEIVENLESTPDKETPEIRRRRSSRYQRRYNQQRDLRNRILGVLMTCDGLTTAEIQGVLGARKTKMLRALDKLVQDQDILCTGSGVKANPNRYYLTVGGNQIMSKVSATIEESSKKQLRSIYEKGIRRQINRGVR